MSAMYEHANERKDLVKSVKATIKVLQQDAKVFTRRLRTAKTKRDLYIIQHNLKQLRNVDASLSALSSLIGETVSKPYETRDLM